MSNRIASIIGIRNDEGPLVGSLTVLFAVTQASQGLGVNAADTLFFLRFGVEHLPVMILASGPLLMIATLTYAGGLGRIGAARWLTPILSGLAVLLILERVAIEVDLPGIYAVVWLGAQMAMLISYTVMWNSATETCTTRQAKRLFPIFASAGIAGGIVGNALTGVLARSLGTENLLLVQAALLLVASVVMAVFVRRFFRPAEPGPRPTISEDLRSGLRLTRDTPLLAVVAWLAVAFSILFFLVAFPFSEVVAGSFTDEFEVANFLGLFSAAATAMTFAISLFAANRLLARVGVVATLLILPVVYAAGFGWWLVSFSLTTATLVRGVQWVAVNALGGTAWNALFNVLPGRRRSQVMAFVTGIPTQIGTMASGALLLVASALPQVWRGVMGLAVAMICIALVLKMRTAYTGALVQAVQFGSVDVLVAPVQGLGQLVLDTQSLSILSARLDDPSPGARSVAAGLLGRLAPDRSIDLIRKALTDKEPRVRRATLEGIAHRPGSAELALTMLADPSAEVRRRAMQILVTIEHDLESSTVIPLLDPDPEVRAMAATLVEPRIGGPVIDEMLGSDDPHVLIAALTAVARVPDLASADPGGFVTHPDRKIRAVAARCLVGKTEKVGLLRPMLDDPSIGVRTAAAETLAASPATSRVLLDVLSSGSVRASDAALQALTEVGSYTEELNGWIGSEVERACYLRFHRVALENGPASPTQLYLRQLLLMRQRHLERWALMALSGPDIESMMPVVRRGVWSDDPETRSQAIEALDSIAPRNRIRGLIALLEDEVRDGGKDPRISLKVLVQDHDEWIRGLATRSLMEELHDDFDLVRGAADIDRSGLVRAAVSRWTLPHVQETHTLDTMDRVLALQRAHMFSDIDPEDLERVAAVAVEKRYEPDEVIYALGEHGDEMLVVVGGIVDVRRQDGSLIHSYGPGDHVGELALLRGGTRAATVIAGSDIVYALALGAPEFAGILEERPEVALAMLATLAERLSAM